VSPVDFSGTTRKLNAQLDELESNSKIRNTRDLNRGINNYKKVYQPRTNILKDENCDLVTDCHSIMTI
jgi:hypothetical protein